MKRLMLLFVSALVLVSCDTDDGPNIGYAVAEITDADLPDYFETGETYAFDVSYQLPNACHDFYTFQTNQYKSEDKDSTLVIEIGALTTYDPNLTECTEEGELNDSKKISGLKINSKLYNNYHFKLLTGGDEDNNAQYLNIEVPVGKPEPETPEEAN
ncbi:hypothetical protein [Salegentibacter echinorum]|nr:hypothetical protein [Salegentibacter echinorum]